MLCPFCKADGTAVIDSRASDDGTAIRRRRQCSACGKRFTTFERAELNMPAIIKRSGERRDYDRSKVRASMKLALRKRPVTDERLETVLFSIERQLRAIGGREVPSSKVGELVLSELKKLDAVAYLRFASVYFNVQNPEAFSNLLRELEEDAAGAGSAS